MTQNQKGRAYIIYAGERVYVTVDGTFQGGSGVMANVTAISGYPFHSGDVQSQGDTFGPWNCNGRRVRVDFVMIETESEREEVENESIISWLGLPEPTPHLQIVESVQRVNFPWSPEDERAEAEIASECRNQ